MIFSLLKYLNILKGKAINFQLVNRYNHKNTNVESGKFTFCCFVLLLAILHLGLPCSYAWTVSCVAHPPWTSDTYQRHSFLTMMVAAQKCEPNHAITF